MTTAADALPEHDPVAVLRPGVTTLERNRATGTLVVVRRLGPGAGRRARAREAARAGAPPLAGPVALAGADGALVAARPWVEGTPLAELLGAGLDDRRALAILRGIAGALSALHARGFAHGTLHPGNVVVAPGGEVVLTGSFAEGPPALDATRAPWTAPEVVRGAAPSRAADVFALGALGHALLGGRRPIAAEAPLAAAHRVLFAPPLRLAVARPELPARIADALDAALARSPRRRPGARAVADALGDALWHARADAPRDAPTDARRDARAGALGAEASPDVLRGAPAPATTAPAIATALVAGFRTPPSAVSPPASAEPHRAADPARAAAPVSTGAPTSSAAAAEAHLSAIAASLRARLASARAAVRSAASAAASAAAHRLRRSGPLARAALVAAPLAAIAFVALPREPAWEREVAGRLDAGDLAGARAAVERAARDLPGDPGVEKLRGDVACARGDAGECARRYRAALERDRALASDRRLRENVLRLVERGGEGPALVAVAARADGLDAPLLAATRSARFATRWTAVRALEARGRADRIDYAEVYALDLGGDASCGAKRAAAARLAALRDPRVLPRLEEARRRNAGIGGFFCVGDAIDRAVVATRAAR